MKVYLLESQDNCFEFPRLLGIFESRDKIIEVMRSLEIRNIEEKEESYKDGFYYANDKTFYNVSEIPINEYEQCSMQDRDDYDVTNLEL